MKKKTFVTPTAQQNHLTDEPRPADPLLIELQGSIIGGVDRYADLVWQIKDAIQKMDGNPIAGGREGGVEKVPDGILYQVKDKVSDLHYLNDELLNCLSKLRSITG